MLEYTWRVADVYTYDQDIAPKTGIPIVTGATAWTDPVTGETYVIVINEALFYGAKLDHSLINPNQIRSYEIPLWDNPWDKWQGLTIDVEEDLKICYMLFFFLEAIMRDYIILRFSFHPWANIH